MKTGNVYMRRKGMDMREIKFRAWDSKQKRFGYIHVNPYGISWPKKDWMSFLGQEEGCNIQDVESIQQFTGLHDKKGKEIYEGDIYRRGEHFKKMNKETRKYEVHFKWHSYPWVVGSCLFCGGVDIPCGGDTFEVIGNIYENPELVKGDKHEDR